MLAVTHNAYRQGYLAALYGVSESAYRQRSVVLWGKLKSKCAVVFSVTVHPIGYPV
jgi:hypothetical protein